MTTDKNLNIFSDIEKFALYGFPDFNYQQRKKYFCFSDDELAVIMQNVQVHINVYCALQIGYFKAKKMFFQVDFADIPTEDLEFVTHHYFHGRKLLSNIISNYEYYAQHKKITKFFGYQSWSKQFLDILSKQADTIIKRDISPNFIARELIAFLDEIKVVRPAYTPLQIIVSQSLTNERKRIYEILNIELNEKKSLF